MRDEQARLKRLKRLERVRAIARQEAALAAAQAEGTLAQLLGLARRTQAIAEDYRVRRDMNDGLALRQHNGFVSGLAGIQAATSGDVAQARILADRRQEELAFAERRRAAVEERAHNEQRQLDQRRLPLSLGARRQLGTTFE